MSDSNVTHNIFCCTPSLRVIIPTSPPLFFLQYTIYAAAMCNFVNRADPEAPGVAEMLLRNYKIHD